MKNLNKKYTLIALTIILVVIFGIFQFFSHNQEKQSDTASEGTVHSWDPETASFKEYVSYDEMEKELESERKVELDEYNKAIKGTVVEQVQNADIPAYDDENKLAQLQNGSVEVRGPKDNTFPEGVFLWSASLNKDVKSFTVGDFNNDGLNDVAHIVGYTGGGSGYFYNLAIFINEKGKLKYLTQKELGDRVFIKGVKYNSGLFTVDMITQGEGDDFKGYCCANVPATIKYKLENNKLVER